MFAEKIKLTQDYIDLIVKKRKEHHLTAYELSEKLGKNKSWIPNIENHRTKNISKENLFLIFDSFAKEEDMDTEKYILKYLHPHAIVQLDDGNSIPCEVLQTRYKLSELDSYSEEYFYNYYVCNDETSMQKNIKELKTAISTLLGSMSKMFPYLTLKQQAEAIRSIYSIEENYVRLPALISEFLKIDIFSEYPADEGGKHAQQYREEFRELISITKNNFKLFNAKAKVYSFFTEGGNEFSINYRLANFDFGSYEELESILSDIEQYVFAVYRYVQLAYDYSDAPNIDLKKIYSKAKQFLTLFTVISKISYNVEFPIPQNDASKDTVNTTQLQLANMLYEIKQQFFKKFNMPEESESPQD